MRRFALTAILSVATGLGIGAAVVLQPMVLVLSAVAIGAIGLSFFCFERYPTVYLGAVAWIYLQYFLTRDLQILPQAGAWGDEAGLFGLALGAFLKNLARGRMPWRRMRGGMLFALIFVAALVSGFINNVPPKTILLGIRGLLQPFLFYVVIAQFDFDASFGRRVTKLIDLLVLAQIPICMWQYLRWHPGLPYMHEDASFGTFGFGTANILGWLLLIFGFRFAFLARDGLIARNRAVLACAGLAFTLLLTSSRIALMSALPLLAFVILKSRLPRKTRVAALGGAAGLGALGLIVAGMIFSEVVPTDAAAFEEIWENQTSKKSGGGRIFWFLDSQTVVQRFSPFPLLGLGPGNYASFTGFTFGAPLLQQRLGLMFKQPGTSFSPDVTVMSSELGFLGLGLHYLLLGGVFRRSARLAARLRRGWARSLADTVRIFALVMMLAALTNTVWQTQFMAGTFWVLTGVLDRLSDLLGREDFLASTEPSK
jgi:hypothetical protein